MYESSLLDDYDYEPFIVARESRYSQRCAREILAVCGV